MMSRISAQPHFKSIRLYGQDEQGNPCVRLHFIDNADAKLYVGQAAITSLWSGIEFNQLPWLKPEANMLFPFKSDDKNQGDRQQFLNGLLVDRVYLSDRNAEIIPTLQKWLIEPLSQPHPNPIIQAGPNDLTGKPCYIDLTLWRVERGAKIQRALIKLIQKYPQLAGFFGLNIAMLAKSETYWNSLPSPTYKKAPSHYFKE